jgi:hypothetical protein
MSTRVKINLPYIPSEYALNPSFKQNVWRLNSCRKFTFSEHLHIIAMLKKYFRRGYTTWSSLCAVVGHELEKSTSITANDLKMYLHEHGLPVDADLQAGRARDMLPSMAGEVMKIVSETKRRKILKRFPRKVLLLERVSEDTLIPPTPHSGPPTQLKKDRALRINLLQRARNILAQLRIRLIPFRIYSLRSKRMELSSLPMDMLEVMAAQKLSATRSSFEDVVSSVMASLGVPLKFYIEVHDDVVRNLFKVERHRWINFKSIAIANRSTMCRLCGSEIVENQYIHLAIDHLEAFAAYDRFLVEGVEISEFPRLAELVKCHPKPPVPEIRHVGEFRRGSKTGRRPQTAEEKMKPVDRRRVGRPKKEERAVKLE